MAYDEGIYGSIRGNKQDLQTYLGFLSGDIQDLSGLSDMGLIGNRYFQEPRFASRAAYMGYVTDPSVNRYRAFLRDMLRGGMVEDKLRAVSREAVGRATAAERIRSREQLGGYMGAGLSAPGMEAYLNRKFDSALAGQMGEAYRQAAVADINARTSAGQAIERDALNKYNMMMNIANMSAQSTPYVQKRPNEKNPWKALGMQALGTAAGIGLGAATGGIMGAILPEITAAQGAMVGMGWDPMLAMYAGFQQPEMPAAAAMPPAQYSYPIGPSYDYGYSPQSSYGMYGPAPVPFDTPPPNIYGWDPIRGWGG